MPRPTLSESARKWRALYAAKGIPLSRKEARDLVKYARRHRNEPIKKS